MKEYSKSPITNKKYFIPQNKSDKIGIENFLSKNLGKQIIVVQGLGFVGAVMSVVCANSRENQYAVIGIDIANNANYWKIASINDGVFPIVASDPKVQEFYDLTRYKNNFYATYDPCVYSKADYIIVDINLDVDKQSDFNGELVTFDVDLQNFKKAIKSIGDNCRDDVLILVETTVPPGTCKKVIKPILDNSLEERNLSTENYKLGHSYERVMPGPEYIDSIKNFYRVYSGVDDKSADATENFLKTIISIEEYPLTRLSNTNSTELAKVLENSYRAMNIAFVTEWSRFAEESKVNLFEVVDAIRMRPTHSNMMYPGIGVGGYCLTKDPLLASWAKQNHFKSIKPLTQSVSGVEINDRMPHFAFDFMKKIFNIKNLKNKKMLFLGVSYRSNVGDTRFTPVEKFYNFCKKEGANINLHDPYVSYWDELNLKVNSDLLSSLNNDFEILIISTSHDEYKNSDLLKNELLKKESMFIFDTVGLLSEKEIKIISKKHNVKVLGRGDL